MASLPDKGKTWTVTAKVLITGVGQLSAPKYPDIPGLETFQGPVIHSARWDHSVSFEGKKVASIGSGAR